MNTYGSVACGRRIAVDELDELAKGLGVAPVLARRAPAAGRGGRRVITGDSVNVRRIIGKADLEDVDKALNPMGALSNMGRAMRQPKQMFGGLKSGWKNGRNTGMGGGGLAGLRGPTTARGVGSTIGQMAGARPVATGALAGAGGAGALMAGNGQRNRQPSYAPPSPMYGGFGKRSYDPEAERRFRQGAYATGAGAAGLASGAYALREARDATKVARRGAAFGPHAGNLQVIELENAAGNKIKAKLVSQRAVHVADRLKSGGLATSRRGAVAALGSLASLGTAGALIRNRHEERWD